jgi:hypothetical protein
MQRAHGVCALAAPRWLAKGCRSRPACWASTQEAIVAMGSRVAR